MYMGLTSLQVCMDSSDWLQGTIHEDNGMDSSSPSGDMLTCSRPLMERRLRPQHDQALNCPRCDSTHTKFCYYNNYSLSQPRYFCKTCRRYWTKGGTLRNIPVGGGCRKNKKASNSKKPTNDQLTPGSHNPTDLQLSFPEVQLSHLTNFLGNNGTGGIGNFGSFMDPITRPIDFMDTTSSRNQQDFGDHMGMVGHHADHQLGPSNNFHALCSPPFGMSLDGNINNNYGNTGAFMENCQRLMLPYEVNEDQNAMLDVKPNSKLLSLEWTDQGCSDGGKDYPFGYINSLGSWSGLINGCGASTSTNPLV